jgi:hypothetical protein
VIVVRSLAELALGASAWAYARGYWRQVRVVAKNRTTVRVAYYIQATRAATATVRVQDLPLHRFRQDPPPGNYGIVRTPAPAPSLDETARSQAKS